MAGSFSAQVDEWVRQTSERMLAVFRTSAQFVIEEAQTPRAKGGNMRVDTGFLRASGTASLSGVPPIRPNYRPPDGAGPGSFAYEGGSVTLAIAGAELGDTIYFGWTASYAGYRENKDGFMRLAAQRWQSHVDRATTMAKQAAGAA